MKIAVIIITIILFYLVYALIEAAVISFIHWLKGNARQYNKEDSWVDEYRKRNNL